LTERVRQTADERRATVLEAAIAEFAARGYHGTPTEAIAKRAGISHAYLFRLYATKKELFLACADRCFDRTVEAFREAVANAGDETPRSAMGSAYVELLGNRDLVLLQQQVYAAGDDDEIRARGRERYEGLRDEIARLGGLSETETLKFIGQGMLLNVVTSLGFPAEDWVFLGAEDE
jgi:AcrR family transcriptional regulator